MDFDKFFDSVPQGLPIEPRELYEQLPNKKRGYGYLRDVQAQVLVEWHERRTERDLVLKVNTGGGKTIDGLVILQSYLNEGMGPALYVAPNRYLERQVKLEAENLDIAVVNDVDDRRYLASEAIGIVNAYKLFNGQTVFSENRISRPPAPIGSVVIDDAHAALSTVAQTLSLSIPDSSELFGSIVSLFEPELIQQSANTLADIREKSHSGALLRVPFWAVRKKVDKLREILRPATLQGGLLYYPWPAVRELLAISRIVVTQSAITIAPPCPPTDYATSFANAERRVYLSATLADDSVLVSDFGAQADNVGRPITPLTAGDIGERMILAPQEINPSVSADDIRAEVVKLAAEYNTVVIVPSNPSAERWRASASETPSTTEQIDAVVERLKSGVHVGLVVFVNRYDGIDLPQDACRVLVLDGLPGAFSGEERLESLLTSRESGVDDRQVQRLEQGMGRAVRSNEDHCVVLLIGARLAQLTADPRTSDRFSPATQAQLELSRRIADSLDEQPLSAIIDTARQALDRDPKWTKLAKQSLKGIAPKSGSVAAHAVARRSAFNAAEAGDFTTAARFMGEAVEAELSPKLRGWLREQHAVYLDPLDPMQSQDVLRIARAENKQVLKPIVASEFQPLESVASQSVTAAANLVGMFGTGTALRLGIEAMLDDLVFDPERTEEFEAAFKTLGSVLGLGSQRPELELKEGPDNLWALGGGHYWVVEAKSGATSPKIAKRDAGQLGQAVLWFGKRYASECSAIPVMVHLSDTLYRDATAPPGMVVMGQTNLDRLKANVRGFAESLVSADRARSDVVAGLLVGHNLTAEELKGYVRAVRG